MDYLREIGIDAPPSDRRSNEPLIEPGSGVTGASVRLLVTPPGEGSAAGLHTHVFDQILLHPQRHDERRDRGAAHEADAGSGVIGERCRREPCSR